MNHNYSVSGYTYELSPVQIEDAELIIKIRLEDLERNKYIHPIKNDVRLQKEWLENYFRREGDYFFKIVNAFTKEVEGLIAIYNQTGAKAEWGRWTIKKGSLASMESVYLLFELAFNTLNLEELFCRTIEDNAVVVDFHNSIGLIYRERRADEFELKGEKYACVEHYITKVLYLNTIKNILEEKCQSLLLRNVKMYSGGFEFHHLGIACTNINREKKIFQNLGYHFEQLFEDKEQGIRGVFAVAKGQPRIELLENIEGSETLTPYIENGIKIYHYGYYVNDISKCCDFFTKIRAKQISPLKYSVYFKRKICFYMLPNMMLVELIEM